jgi:hypothetical protein
MRKETNIYIYKYTIYLAYPFLRHSRLLIFFLFSAFSLGGSEGAHIDCDVGGAVNGKSKILFKELRVRGWNLNTNASSLSEVSFSQDPYQTAFLYRHTSGIKAM